jgi:Glycosyltransferase family 9 (heptosyltransferase)
VQRQVPLTDDAPKSVLILHAGAVGDTVLMMHIAAAIGTAHPDARIAVAARNRIVHWLASRGACHRALDLESLSLHILYNDDGRLPDDHPIRHNDWIISFLDAQRSPEAQTSAARFTNNLKRSTDATLFALNPQSIDVPQENCPSPSHRRAGSTRRDRHRSRRRVKPALPLPRHITQQWTDQLRAQGITLPPIESHSRLLICDRQTEPTIICHPGSGGRDKCAPIDVFINIVRKLQSRAVPVAWMIGPTERDWFGPSFVERLEAIAPVIEEHDIAIAANHIARATGYVGNDAGMTHLAASLGLTTLALFGPTAPAIWSPLGPAVHIRSFDRPNDIAEDLPDALFT